MTTDGWRVRWLFGLLDYQHFELTYRTLPVGMAIVNGMDRSVYFQPYDPANAEVLDGLPRTYAAACRWIELHET